MERIEWPGRSSALRCKGLQGALAISAAEGSEVHADAAQVGVRHAWPSSPRMLCIASLSALHAVLPSANDARPSSVSR